jgi:hypothetical protein
MIRPPYLPSPSPVEPIPPAQVAAVVMVAALAVSLGAIHLMGSRAIRLVGRGLGLSRRAIRHQIRVLNHATRP